MDGYSASQHWTYTILGLLLMVILVFTLRMELTFLSQYRKHIVQFILSVSSIFIMLYLTLTLLFHWSLPQVITVTTLMLLVPVLLILSPIILYLRYRTFRSLIKDRIVHRRQLVQDVMDMMDEKKRQKIREGKLKRGEPLDE